VDPSGDIGSKVADLARDDGLLLNSPRANLLRFMPALNLSQEEIDTMVTMLEKALVRASAAQTEVKQG